MTVKKPKAKSQIVTPKTPETLVERLLIYRTFGGCRHTHTVMDGGMPTVVVSWFYLSTIQVENAGVVEVIFHGHNPRVLIYDAVDLARETMGRGDQFDWMDVAKRLLRPLRKFLRLQGARAAEGT